MKQGGNNPVNGNVTSILMSAGHYASQTANTNTQHHIPIRNTTTAGQLLMQGVGSTTSGGVGQNILMNRGSS